MEQKGKKEVLCTNEAKMHTNYPQNRRKQGASRKENKQARNKSSKQKSKTKRGKLKSQGREASKEANARQVSKNGKTPLAVTCTSTNIRDFWHGSPAWPAVTHIHTLTTSTTWDKHHFGPPQQMQEHHHAHQSASASARERKNRQNPSSV